ncbi:MAG TPA: PAS domain-containing sensor histidine kinase [Verrucomicrobiae bacterium]|nr:PAS domain-containing sensor histidine kinase [Verrucomicrobiae bacterium]
MSKSKEDETNTVKLEQLSARNFELERVNRIVGHYRALVEGSDDIILSTDLNGVIETANPAVAKYFGYGPQEIVGKSVLFWALPENEKFEVELMNRVRAGEPPAAYETILRRKDGKCLNVWCVLSPIADASGKVIGISKIVRDISDRAEREMELRRTQEDLKKTNENLELAKRAMDDFFAVLSHELRTPLNPIMLLASDNVTNPSLPPQVAADFKTILQNAETQGRLIDDLLDLARIRSGKMRIRPVDTNIHDIILNSIAMVKGQAEQKDVALASQLNDPNTRIFGDAVRLQQVFSNVLRNAIKFTPAGGGVTIQAGMKDQEYKVTISDTGNGMTHEELAQAFEPFKQGAQGPESGGLGVGLAICKQLVERHGGAIEASSPGRGRGSTLTIKLPLPATGPRISQ